MKKSVRVVKRSKRSGSEREVKVPLVRNKLSKSIQSWVVEFRKKEQEQLPGFDSLFTDKVPSVEIKNACLPKSGKRETID